MIWDNFLIVELIYDPVMFFLSLRSVLFQGAFPFYLLRETIDFFVVLCYLLLLAREEGAVECCFYCSANKFKKDFKIIVSSYYQSGFIGTTSTNVVRTASVMFSFK